MKRHAIHRQIATKKLYVERVVPGTPKLHILTNTRMINRLIPRRLERVSRSVPKRRRKRRPISEIPSRSEPLFSRR